MPKTCASKRHKGLKKSVSRRWLLSFVRMTQMLQQRAPTRVSSMKAILQTACGLFGFIVLMPTSVVGQSQLPVPTGKYGIGRLVLHWTDSARRETQSEKPGSPRELLVYLCYPTDPESRGVRAEYFPHLKEVEAYEERFGKNLLRKSYGDSYKTISTLRSYAIENAHLAAGKEQFPVLIFAHGGGIPVLYYTAIIENLVSHGYVVAAVEHTFDGATVRFPNGRIVSQTGWDEDTKRNKDERAAFHASRHRVGSQDNSF